MRNIKRSRFSEYNVVAIVDDELNKQKLSLMNVKVYGTTKDIPRIVQEKKYRCHDISHRLSWKIWY